jgi:hypothetical protein
MRRAFLAMIAIVLAVTGVGCPCARSAVNASPELRWWLFSNFAASRICPEMLKRGVPLKLPELGAASVGRFFPSQCNTQIDDARRALVMSIAGTGYVFLPFTQRIGFYFGTTVEYLPDFRLEEDATYVWGKFNRFVTSPDLRILGVENPIVNLATRTPIGTVATLLGNGVAASEIGRGFTVVHQDSGDDFALGHLDPPAKPIRPYKAGEGRVLLESDVTVVHAQAREFLGPFEVARDDAALYLRARTAPPLPINFIVVERSVGENWRRHYEAAEPLGPPPGVVVTTGTIARGEIDVAFPVPRGTYYIVLENSAPVPLLGSVTDQGIQVSYGVDIGDRR